MSRQPRVWADIDLGVISSNLARIRDRLRRHRNVMLVVKADAYGHGAVPIARHVDSGREVRAFGVGDSQEALELRESGIDAPILILGAIVDGEMEDVVREDIAVCVHSLERVRRLERVARRLDRRCRVHVMVDTGMGRLGPFRERALEVADAASASAWLDLEGIATHFSSTGTDGEEFTAEQIGRFVAFADDLADRVSPLPVMHAANSAALLRGDEVAFDMVRVGAAAYGIQRGVATGSDPALSLRTQVIYMKDVPAGTPISYDRLHVTKAKTRIATLPIGYNDGFPYRLSDRFHVLVRGRRAPVVGAVSMDYCMVDVGDIPGVRTGDRVTLIGEDGDDRITVADVAAALETVPHEVTCGLGKRVHKRYTPAPVRPTLVHAVRERTPEPLRGT